MEIYTTEGENMKVQKRDYVNIAVTILLFITFCVFTILVKTVDVGIAGFSGVEVGFSTINQRIFNAFRNETLEKVSDILGYLGLLVMLSFAVVGLIQLIKRKSIKKIDHSLICLAGIYVLTIVTYILFELIKINYRPILVDGELQASYPSSHTMLAIVAFISGGIQIGYLTDCEWIKPVAFVCGTVFALAETLTRLLAGVHWFTDIIGSVIIGATIVMVYVTALELIETNSIPSGEVVVPEDFNLKIDNGTETDEEVKSKN